MEGEIMDKLKVVFMGTPLFSVNVLNALADNYDVVLVVTSPDAYVGRKKILTPCPVKRRAIELGIPVISPVKVSVDYGDIVNAKPDVIITCAYGQIVSKIFLIFLNMDVLIFMLLYFLSIEAEPQFIML